MAVIITIFQHRPTLTRYLMNPLKMIKATTIAFFQINKKVGTVTNLTNISKTISLGVFYRILDYWASILCAAMVGWLNYLKLSFWIIVITTWVFDFFIALGFLIVTEKLFFDITLGQAYRRAAETIQLNSKILAWFIFVILVMKATIWDGPELVVVFFKKELKTIQCMIITLACLTFIQGLFWAALYTLGYESILN